MAYFLKKTNNKKGTYLQIYSSFYDPQRGHTAHKAYKPSLILRTPILTVLTFTLKLIKKITLEEKDHQKRIERNRLLD